MKKPAPSPRRIATPLASDEQLLASWRPNFTLFAQRSVLLSFATALALSSLGYLDLRQWLVAVPVLTVLFVFLFDDHLTWFRVRDEAWHLTTHRLIYEKAGAPEDNAAVPLRAVEWTEPWFWWALRLGFEGGTSTAMRFVARPRDIQARIAAARAAAAAPGGGTA
ncbi:MAG: hypothetical protein R3D85_09270 [Paracoccaceae bacterium]